MAFSAAPAFLFSSCPSSLSQSKPLTRRNHNWFPSIRIVKAAASAEPEKEKATAATATATSTQSTKKAEESGNAQPQTKTTAAAAKPPPKRPVYSSEFIIL